MSSLKVIKLLFFLPAILLFPTLSYASIFNCPNGTVEFYHKYHSGSGACEHKYKNDGDKQTIPSWMNGWIFDLEGCYTHGNAISQVAPEKATCAITYFDKHFDVVRCRDNNRTWHKTKDGEWKRYFKQPQLN